MNGSGPLIFWVSIHKGTRANAAHACYHIFWDYLNTCYSPALFPLIFFPSLR